MKQISNLSIRDLQFLAEVGKYGVVLRAGQFFNLSPSAASRNFSRIRACFPSEIFEQKDGKWEPTDYYREIRPQLEAILRAASSLEEQAFDPKESVRTFVLTCMMTEITSVISGILPKLIERAPKVRLDLSKHENELAAVMEGKADFAVVTEVDLPPEVHTLRLYPITRVILLRKGHPLTRIKGPLLTRYLQPYDRVSIRTGRSASWTSPDQGVFTYERFMEHTRYSTSRFYSAWGAMEKTDLIAVCGWKAAEIAMRAYKLTALALPVDFETPEMWNSLIWSDARHRDPAHIWVRGLFREWAEEDALECSRKEAAGKGPPKNPVQTKTKRPERTV